MRVQTDVSTTDQDNSKASIIYTSEFSTLQAAVDAVPDSGGEIIISPGNYELTEPLVLTKKNVYIKGAGPSTHLINSNQNGEPALIIRPKDNSDPKIYIWRIHLSDFRISGKAESGDGIYLENINELFISGLTVDHHGGNGMNLKNCLENPRINHCNITYNKKAGMYIYGNHDCIVSSNQFEENNDALQFVDGFNLTMNDNNIDDHFRHGIILENTYACVLSGNMIERCEGRAMILDRDCYGITISANVMTHNGMELRDAWGCTVSANTFVVMRDFSVFIGPNSGRNVITGNNFCNSYIGDEKIKRPTDPSKTNNIYALDGGAGIILEGTSDISIAGNVFGGLSKEAVRADKSCNRILIAGNVITDTGRRSATRIAINLGDAQNSILKDNAIDEGLTIVE